MDKDGRGVIQTEQTLGLQKVEMYEEGTVGQNTLTECLIQLISSHLLTIQFLIHKQYIS